MYQLLKFDSPIPSCAIHALEFNDGKWTFIYALNTPFELNDWNDKDLIVYEYISDLHVKDAKGIHEESINLRFKTLTEYIDLLMKQQYADNKYREDWKIKNPDSKPITVTLNNRNYSFEEIKSLGIHFIASIFCTYEGATEFAAI